MSISAAKGASKFGLRDQREPGHFWADNEIFDVFGDQLGPNGILLYIAMARMCWGPDVRASIREIAAQARMSKSTVDRTMKLLVKIGLIEEERGDKLKTASAYRIVNAKRLAAHYVAERMKASGGSPATSGESVPREDSAPTPRPDTNAKPSYTKTADVAPSLARLLYPTVGQMAEVEKAVDKKISPAPAGTELSHPDANLSHTSGPFNTQDSRPQDQGQVLPPTPQGGSGASGVGASGLGSSGLAASGLEAAVYGETKRVLRECALSDPRLAPVVTKAMWQAMETHGRQPSEVADTMIANHAAYVRSGPMLRFAWGPRKFFAEGHWLNHRGWPLDQKLVAASQRL